MEEQIPHMADREVDEVVEAVEKLKKEWDNTLNEMVEHVREIEGYGKPGKEALNTLPRLNAAVQDGLSLLRSLQFRLDLLSEQLPTEEEINSAKLMLKSWKDQYNRTKAGMTSAAESITESLRRTRQLMVQEVERSANTLMTFDNSTSVLRKAEGEYKGHRSLLMRTRNLLSTMQRQDIIERIILVVGFLFFASVVLYIFTKRIGLLKLQRKLSSAFLKGSGHESTSSQMTTRAADGLSPPSTEEKLPLRQTHDEL
ncbi:transport protein [Nymphaea thermarum]|nr:transport protein [Nymphaea thermarum]